MEIFLGFTLHEFVFQLLLPFCFVFILLYGVLQGMRIFDKRINVAISLIATLFFMLSPAYSWLLLIFERYVAFFVLGLIILVFFVGMALHAGIKLKGIVKPEDKVKKKKEEAAKLRAEAAKLAASKEWEELPPDVKVLISEKLKRAEELEKEAEELRRYLQVVKS